MADNDFRVKNGIVVGSDAFISNSITQINSISFNTTQEFNPGVGSLAWDNAQGSISLGLSNTVDLQLGLKNLFYVKNQSGSTISSNTVVMANGTVGNSGTILISPAIGNGNFPARYIIGVTAESIDNGEDGYVLSFGKLREINTSMFSEGDILYLDPVNPGKMVNTEPVAPSVKAAVAIVVTKHPTAGEIFVRPTFSDKLLDIQDVAISNNISNGQSIVWVSANSRFENMTVSADQSNTYNTYTTLTANDYNTLLSAQANDYNTLFSAYSNDYATLLSAQSNDGATLLSASANDYNTLLSAYSNDGATLLSASANDYTTLLAAYSNDLSTLNTARANDYNTLLTAQANDYNSFTTLTANSYNTLLASYSNDLATLNTARANDYNSFTTLTANIYNTFAYLNANVGGSGDASNAWVNANDYNSYTTLTANIYNTYTSLFANLGVGGGNVTNTVSITPIFSGALRTTNATQTLGTASWTTLTGYDNVIYDTNSFTTVADRFTIPAGVTKVKLAGSVAGTSAIGQLITRILKNADTAISYTTEVDIESTGADNGIAITPAVSVVEGDYFVIQAFSDNSRTVSVDLVSWFSIEVVEGSVLTATANLTISSAGNAWVNANDFSTYSTLTANSYNTLLASYSNDLSTLNSARANDYATLLSAQSNDFNSYTTLTANDYNSFTTLTANIYNTFAYLNANVGGGGGDVANAWVNANDYTTFTTLTANIYNTFAYLNANVGGGGGGDVANAWVNANDFNTYTTLTANIYNTYDYLQANGTGVTDNLARTLATLALP